MSLLYSARQRNSFKALSFSLGETCFAVEILHIQEIINQRQARKTPGAHGYIDGVISFRKTVLPIVDLRKMFQIKSEIKEKAKIIVYQVNDNLIGFTVDRAYQVVDLQKREIKPTPPVLMEGLPEGSLLGVFEMNGHTNILLDFKECISGQEQMLFDTMVFRE